MLFRDTRGGFHTSITIEKLEDLRDFVWGADANTSAGDTREFLTWKPVIYIAGPYTNGDPVLNTRKAVEAADKLHQMGYIPIIPHLSMLWHTISPKDYDWWMEYDYELMDLCDGVVRLPGVSEGADLEAKHWVEQVGYYRPFVYLEES